MSSACPRAHTTISSAACKAIDSTAGCIIGDSDAADWTRDRDSWSGKCFTDFENDNAVPSSVLNIYTSDAMERDWEQDANVGGILQLPGAVTIGPSWCALSSMQRSLSLWPAPAAFYCIPAHALWMPACLMY